MTFTRKKTIKGHDYFYLQKSIRVGDTVKSIHMGYIGKKGSSIPIDSIDKGKYTKVDVKKIRDITTESKRLIFQDLNTKNEIKAYQRLFERGFDSREKFYNKKTKSYQPDRAKLHEKLIKDVDKLGAKSKKGVKPRVIFVGGPPGSGKSTVLAKNVKSGNFVVLNNDDFKEALPEYRGVNANFVHEEASDIFDSALRTYARKKRNIMIDATLKNTEKVKNQIKSFRKLDYDVELIATNLKSEEAIKRATARFLSNNRYVSLEYIGQNTGKINQSAFDIAPFTDKFTIFSTDVKKGEAPILLTRGVNKERKPIN